MADSNKSANLKFYTTQEVADILKMNVQVIARKLQQGNIPGYKIGKDWRIAEKDLLQWIEKFSNQKKRTLSEKVFSSFIRDGQVTSLPVQRKKRRYVLEYILKQFEPGKVYREDEVNRVVMKYYDDYCTVRREFIMEKMMTRSGGKYMRNTSYKFQPDYRGR
jgi:excisionase family DNA binding protein